MESKIIAKRVIDAEQRLIDIGGKLYSENLQDGKVREREAVTNVPSLAALTWLDAEHVQRLAAEYELPTSWD